MTELAPDDDSMAVLVYGDGVVSTEITDSMIDSVLLVGPWRSRSSCSCSWSSTETCSTSCFGLLGIALVLVWTFGAMGWFDIAFSQPFIVILVLLIGLSIDYGLHVVMRYREARESSETAPNRAMAVALRSVGVALVYVTTTTVIGFLSNLTTPPARGVPRTRRRQRYRDRGHAARLRPARSGVESRTRRTARTSRDRPLETGHRNRGRADQSPPGYGETLATKAPTSSSPSRSSSARRVRTGRQTSTQL